MTEVILVRTVQTCTACPSQWDAWDLDGNYWYLRYRHGRGTAERQPSPDSNTWAWKANGDISFDGAAAGMADGVISLEDSASSPGSTWRWPRDRLAAALAQPCRALQDDDRQQARRAALTPGLPPDPLGGHHRAAMPDPWRDLGMTDDCAPGQRCMVTFNGRADRGEHWMCDNHMPRGRHVREPDTVQISASEWAAEMERRWAL